MLVKTLTSLEEPLYFNLIPTYKKTPFCKPLPMTVIVGPGVTLPFVDLAMATLFPTKFVALESAEFNAL